MANTFNLPVNGVRKPSGQSMPTSYAPGYNPRSAQPLQPLAVGPIPTLSPMGAGPIVRTQPSAQPPASPFRTAGTGPIVRTQPSASPVPAPAPDWRMQQAPGFGRNALQAMTPMIGQQIMPQFMPPPPAIEPVQQSGLQNFLNFMMGMQSQARPGLDQILANAYDPGQMTGVMQPQMNQGLNPVAQMLLQRLFQPRGIFQPPRPTTY